MGYNTRIPTSRDLGNRYAQARTLESLAAAQADTYTAAAGQSRRQARLIFDDLAPP